MNIFSKQAVIPAFPENNNLIVLAADNNYAPYLGVCVESIAENCISTFNYDIVVLETNIDENYKERMIKMLANYNNVSLRFYNLSAFDDYMRNLKQKTNAYFTAATYYRLYAPEIFYKYDRMLYLDCDLAVAGDFSELLNLSFDDKVLIAVPDVTVQGIAFAPLTKIPWRCDDYLKDVLKVEDFSKYFQAGVLVFNLKKLREMKFTQKALKKLDEIDRPRWVDQDILNAVLYKKVKYMEVKYNYTYHLEFSENDYQLESVKEHVPLVYNQVQQLKENQPVIIHFTSSKKPWKYPALKYADLWWRYARQTPFYEELIMRLVLANSKSVSSQGIIRKENGNTCYVQDMVSFPKAYLKYTWNRALSHVLWGDTGKRCKAKKQRYHEKVRFLRARLSGK